MAFCSSCGHEIGEGTAFCPACGAKVSAPATPVFDEEDIKENKLIAVFAYVNVLVLVPILAGRKSPFARYHAKQGLVLFVIEAFLHFAYGTLKSVLSPFVAHIAATNGYSSYSSYNWLELVLSLLGVVAFAYIAFAVIGIIRVLRGEAKPLPLIGTLPFLK